MTCATAFFVDTLKVIALIGGFILLLNFIRKFKG